MTKIKASDARIPTQEFNNVAYGHERLSIEHRSGKRVYLISEEDLQLLEALEDRYWADEGIAAITEHEESGEKAIPLERVKDKLGL